MTDFFLLSFFSRHFLQVDSEQCRSKRRWGERREGISLPCQRPFSPPFSSVELCWMETALFREDSFDSDGNLSDLWHLTPKPVSRASITISLICPLSLSLSLVFVLRLSLSAHLPLLSIVFHCVVSVSLFFFTLNQNWVFYILSRVVFSRK